MTLKKSRITWSKPRTLRAAVWEKGSGTGRISVHKIVGKDSSPRKPRQRKSGCGSTDRPRDASIVSIVRSKTGRACVGQRLQLTRLWCQSYKNVNGPCMQSFKTKGDVVMTRPREFRICKHWLNVLQYPVLQADNPQSWIKEFKDKEPKTSPGGSTGVSRRRPNKTLVSAMDLLGKLPGNDEVKRRL